ncbi:hypothetical protein FQN54_005602 [Arachnomyces sp. PD_36]|nr:hypothetical protein FQN54_005602 [Arachnomyces sp. PD_36]
MLSTLPLLIGKKPRPARVRTDEVLPTHFLDDTPGNRSFVLVWTLRFNDVLDANRLHSSLTRLLEMEGWRKLGGRLRTNSKGKLVIHVPEKFTKDRPAVGYSHVSFNSSIGAHPLASQLPKVTEGPSIQIGSDKFSSLGMRKGAPSKLDDFLYSDESLLALHIVSFQDATLVTISWSHAISDGMGLRTLVGSWCQVLAGNEDEVPDFVGARKDPLEQAIDNPETLGRQRWVHQDTILVGFAFLVFAIRFLWEMIFGPKTEIKTLFIPRKTITKLRQNAIADLDSPGPSSTDEKDVISHNHNFISKPFISEGDVLTAWMTRCMALTKPPKSNRGVTVINMFELRGRVPSVFDPARAYVANLMAPTWTLLSIRAITEMPVGHLASCMRKSIVEQTTEAQALAQIRAQKEELGKTGRLPIPGKAGCWLMTFSNWKKMDFFNAVDFSPAVITTGDNSVTRANKPGTPDYFHCIPLIQNMPARDTLSIMGRDAYGNYWGVGMLNAATWRQVEEDLGRLSQCLPNSQADYPWIMQRRCPSPEGIPTTLDKPSYKSGSTTGANRLISGLEDIRPADSRPTRRA